MNNDYPVRNGKRIAVTEEHLRALGIIKKDYNPFERVAVGCRYHHISVFGDVDTYTQQGDAEDDALFNSCNYFNDDSVAQQIALHQLLYRKLQKFTYDNNCIDTAEWNLRNFHWTIRYSASLNKFDAYCQIGYKAPEVYFSSEEDAKRAIKEVVNPFVKEHPNFIW